MYGIWSVYRILDLHPIDGIINLDHQRTTCFAGKEILMKNALMTLAALALLLSSTTGCISGGLYAGGQEIVGGELRLLGGTSNESLFLTNTSEYSMWCSLLDGFGWTKAQVTDEGGRCQFGSKMSLGRRHNFRPRIIAEVRLVKELPDGTSKIVCYGQRQFNPGQFRDRATLWFVDVGYNRQCWFRQ